MCVVSPQTLVSSPACAMHAVGACNHLLRVALFIYNSQLLKTIIVWFLEAVGTVETGALSGLGLRTGRAT